MEWSPGGGVVLDPRHAVHVEAQSSEMADVVLRALRGIRGQGPGEYPTVLAVEPEELSQNNIVNLLIGLYRVIPFPVELIPCDADCS